MRPRLDGLVAVAALGFAFGGTSASDVASVAVVEAYRRVMWTAATLAVAAALMALAWLGAQRVAPQTLHETVQPSKSCSSNADPSPGASESVPAD
jgi:hypothetical protein